MLSKLPKILHKKAKRLGRGAGSGKGNKSSRGTKRHQKAREKIPLHFEGGQAKISKKYPLLRGKGRNKSKVKTINFSLDDLNIFKSGQTVDKKALIESGLLEKKDINANIKVLSSGKVTKKIKLEIKASKAAASAITSAGGSYKDK
ncbi:MAG: 50S ribosomal protein L15 [Patescibacteria group bacterium]